MHAWSLLHLLCGTVGRQYSSFHLYPFSYLSLQDMNDSDKLTEAQARIPCGLATSLRLLGSFRDEVKTLKGLCRLPQQGLLKRKQLPVIPRIFRATFLQARTKT